jgi:hypothetical protein
VTPFQPSLLTWTRPSVSPVASPQGVELARVEGNIAESIIAWCRRHEGAEFHLSALTADVMAATKCAPDSPRRILQQLRDSGQVQVTTLEPRRASLYRVEGVK